MEHRIVTAAQMKQIEASGAAHGLSYQQMMENAGQAVWRELALRCPAARTAAGGLRQRQ